MSSSLKGFSKGITACIYLVSGSLFLVMAVASALPGHLLTGQTELYANTMRLISAPIVLLAIAGLLALMAGAHRLGRHVRHPNGLLACILLGMLCIHLLLATAGYTPIGYDCGVIVELASGPFSQLGNEYLIYYPNNFFLTLVLHIWWKLTGGWLFPDIWLASIVLNILFVDAAIYLIAKTAQRISGNQAMLIALAVSLLVLGISPYLLVPYSDTMVMPFNAGFFYCLACFQQAHDKTKPVYAALMGIMLAGGYLMKPTSLILLIAVLLVGAVCWLGSDRRRFVPARAVLYGLCFCAGLSLLILTNMVKYTLHSPQEWKDGACPSAHFLMMGLKSPGSYDYDDDMFTRSFPDKRTRTQADLQRAQQRLSEHLEDGTLASHLWNKVAWSFSDGVFYYGMDGTLHPNESQDMQGLRGIVHACSCRSSPFYLRWMQSLEQGFWIALTALVGSCVFRRRKPDLLAAGLLALVGLALFLMLFECRSRYVLQFLPVFIGICAVRGNELFDFIQRKRNL